MDRRNVLWRGTIMALLFTLGSAMSLHAETISLKMASEQIGKLTLLRQQQLNLSPNRPPQVRKLPAGLQSPLYGLLHLGPKEHPTSFVILLDAPEGKPSRLFVDANANGNLTDDPLPEWEHARSPGREGESLIVSHGSAKVRAAYGNSFVWLRLTFSRSDTSEPARSPQFLPLFYAADYAREGTAVLGGKSVHFWLVDALSRGDFRGSGIAGQSGLFLLIDVNGNGKIDKRGETYDALEPFNLGGVTYEVRGLDSSGSRIEFVKSARTVAEILPPPDLSVGKPVVPFERTSTEGQAVKFPTDYHGRLVLLYFWATWCGDCQRETPYVVKAYQTFHPQGLDILGISLDKADQGAVLTAYTREHEMPWREIYDGKWWDAEIAKLYYINNTPTALLVDGNTGLILANGTDLEGDKLAPTLQKALDAFRSKRE